MNELLVLKYIVYAAGQISIILLSGLSAFSFEEDNITSKVTATLSVVIAFIMGLYFVR